MLSDGLVADLATIGWVSDRPGYNRDEGAKLPMLYVEQFELLLRDG
jgi:hypothetical protein